MYSNRRSPLVLLSFLLVLAPSAALGTTLSLYSVSEPYAGCPPNTIIGWDRGNVDGTPNVRYNSAGYQVACSCCTFNSHELTFHPGPNGERGVVRWTAPAADFYTIDVTFGGRDPDGASTDVHVLKDGTSLFGGVVTGFMEAPVQFHSSPLQLTSGQVIDVVVGDGGNGHLNDTTALALTITSGSGVWDAASGFSAASNPAGTWSYGWFASASSPMPLATPPVIGAMGALLALLGYAYLRRRSGTI